MGQKAATLKQHFLSSRHLDLRRDVTTTRLQRPIMTLMLTSHGLPRCSLSMLWALALTLTMAMAMVMVIICAVGRHGPKTKIKIGHRQVRPKNPDFNPSRIVANVGAILLSQIFTYFYVFLTKALLRKKGTRRAPEKTILRWCLGVWAPWQGGVLEN